MPGSNTFGGNIKLQGESEYRKAISQITQQLKVMGSEMSKVTAEFGKNDTSTQNLTQKNKILNQEIETQKQKIETLKGALADAQKEYGENSKQANSWQISLNKAEAELISLEKEVEQNNQTLKENEEQEKKLKSAYSNLTTTIDEQENKLQELKTKYVNVVLEQGKNSKEAKTLHDEIKNLNKGLEENKSKLNNAKSGLQDFEEEEENTKQSTLSLSDIIKGNLISEGIIAGIKKLASVAKEIGDAFVDVGKKALNSYADYEQLVGGVETLFKDNAGTVENYANNAYKTAGLSANEYMETVTSFSASLLQSLNGDTAKSAEVADMAITDMSDNANKMGTSMSNIQNAYQGFAKQNYTMLDNLKLGYGGTKSEMERLLKDAQKISGTKYDINNLNDVYQAIHIIQGELGVTGTTAKEASITIQGSVSAMKSAWQNMLTGIATGNTENIGNLMNNLAESVLTAGQNILPRIQEIANGMVTALPQVLSKIDEYLPNLLNTGMQIFQTIVDGIRQSLYSKGDQNGLTTSIVGIIETLVSGIIQMLPDILMLGVEILTSLASGISESLPDLIDVAIDAILKLVDGFLDNIDMIIDAGIQLILSLAFGLIDALPKLIEKAPEIIRKLCDAIIRNFPKIVEIGGELIGNLVSGIVGSVFKLLEVAPQLIANIVNGLKQGWQEIKNVGKYLIEGLWDGIAGMANWVADKVKSFAKNIVGNIKEALGIHSPSTILRDEVGKFMAQGIGVGFSNEMGNITKEMQEAIPTKFDVNSSIISKENSDTSKMWLKQNLIEAFKEFKPTIILKDKEIGEFALDYVNANLGKIY